MTGGVTSENDERILSQQQPGDAKTADDELNDREAIADLRVRPAHIFARVVVQRRANRLEKALDLR